MDALAAGGGDTSSGKFGVFARRHFHELCEGLDDAVLGKSGEMVLYNIFRNGFAHLFAPKTGFAIAEDHELETRL
jgi:hypothetical protein